MLDPDKLKEQLQKGIKDILVPTIEKLEIMKMPTTSKAGTDMAAEVAKTFDDLVSEPLAEILANAIDYYVKNASITGTIITVGSPSTQTASISSMPTPVTNGKVPNTLGIG